MATEWYYARGQQQHGPVTEEQLRAMAASGEVQPTGLVWREGMPQWTEARAVPELFPSPGAAAPPAPGQSTSPPPPFQQQQQHQQQQPPHALGYGHGGAYGYRDGGPPPPNYLAQAILVTIFCCMPLGVVSIVFAAQVNSKHAAGDVPGAIDASNKARMWAWWSFGLGLIGPVLWFLFVAIAGIAGGV